jgi:hypothetical protein
MKYREADNSPSRAVVNNDGTIPSIPHTGTTLLHLCTLLVGLLQRPYLVTVNN